MKRSPTQRTLRHLRDAGYIARVVEKFEPHAKIRQDLFGFGDVLAIRAEPKDLVLVQTTSTGVASRLRKIADLQEETGYPGIWLAVGGRIEVHGWRKLVQKTKSGHKSKIRKVAVRIFDVVMHEGQLASIERPSEVTSQEL